MSPTTYWIFVAMCFVAIWSLKAYISRKNRKKD